MDVTVKSKIEGLKQKIIPVLERYPITKAGLFGSVVSGKDGVKSDVDLLIEFDKDVRLSLLDISGIRLDIMKNIGGRDVDLVEYDFIKPRYRKYILPTEVRIYEKR